MIHSFLTGDKIYLRGLEQNDLEGPYFQWLNDQDSDIYTSHAIWPNSQQKMSNFFNRVSDSMSEIVLAIVEVSSDEHVGNIGLHGINWIHRAASLAILIGESSARGKGYGQEAVKLLVRHAFVRLNLNRIELGVRVDNIYAIKSYKSAGFVEEGIFREAQFGNKKYHDVLRMSYLYSDYINEKK